VTVGDATGAPRVTPPAGGTAGTGTAGARVTVGGTVCDGVGVRIPGGGVNGDTTEEDSIRTVRSAAFVVGSAWIGARVRSCADAGTGVRESGTAGERPAGPPGGDRMRKADMNAGSAPTRTWLPATGSARSSVVADTAVTPPGAFQFT